MMTKKKFSVAYSITCTSYYEETIEAETEEEAKQMAESLSVGLAMEEDNHECGNPVVTRIMEEGEF